MVLSRLNASGGGDRGADAVAAWSRVALTAGWVAGVGLLLQTGLFLLDSANVLLLVSAWNPGIPH